MNRTRCELLGEVLGEEGFVDARGDAPFGLPAMAPDYMPSSRQRITCLLYDTEFIGRGYDGCQVMSTRTGISFLIGTVRKVGAWILKSVSVEGIVPVMRWAVPSIV